MTKVILSLFAVAAIFIGVAYNGFMHLVPAPVNNSVIAEKSDGTLGGQAAALLPANLSKQQHELLNMAYDVAKENGFKNPEILQALLLQETLAGGMDKYKVANPGSDAYFGPMQIKLAAAKDVLAKWPQLFVKFDFHTRTDDEIKANLILNERFNLDVAAKYLLILKQQYGFSGRQLLNAYNRGPGGVHQVDDSFHYAIGAERKLAALKRRL